MTKRGRKFLVWGAAAAAVLVIGGVGGPFVYIHFIEGPPPAKLGLPKLGQGSKGATSPASAASSTTTTTSPAADQAALTGSSGVAGTWKVGSGSVVGYRVQEVLIGQNSTAVGRTSEVWGSLTISGGDVVGGSFTANMSSVKSDQSARNAQFDGRIMDVAAYPTATFKLAKPIALGTLPAPGKVKQYPAAGDLTMHGVTRKVSFTVSTERGSSTIYVLADINIVFGDWGIKNPSVGGFVTTQDHGILEVLLHLTKGTGNPAHAASEATSSGPTGPGGHPPAGKFPSGKFPSGKFPSGKFPSGKFPGKRPAGGAPGGPVVTVPKTTVPPLTIPK